MFLMWFVCFFFKQKTAYEMRISDWSSDVCSSDLLGEPLDAPVIEHPVMQEILVDRGQLVLERLVQEIDDLGIALHGRLLCAGLRLYAIAAAKDTQKMAEIRGFP